jgi:hypothetical protein
MALLILPVLIISSFAGSPALPEIILTRTPNGGIEPRSIVDARGVLRIIYFKGDASTGDIEYVRREPGAKDFSAPIRVNSQPRSAVAIGTVRGPQMALGHGGRAYVVWFGSSQTRPQNPDGTMPVVFSRLNDSGTAFEPQRSLNQYTNETNGGLSVAADQDHVYVVWHARGEAPGEANRRVYLALSADDGRTFTREVPISPAGLGACGCCGMRSFADERGALYVLYRAAAGNVHRDMELLVSGDHGRTFRDASVALWKLNACPMTTNDLSQGRQGVLAAWETAGQIYFSEIDPRSFQLFRAIVMPGKANDRKHPAVGTNLRGQVLVAWTEGTGWSKGGSLAWQLFDQMGHAVGPEGHAAGVPVWGLPSVFADGQGNFTIVY